MSKVIMTIGVSDCGKSTYAQKYIEENPNTIELNRDNVRFNYIAPHAKNWSEYNSNDFNEDLVTDIIHKQFIKAVQEGKDVIISDTNLSPYTRARWIQVANNYECKLEYIVFNSSFEDIFYHNSSRMFNLPDHVLTNQYKKFTRFLEEIPTPGVGYSFI